MRHHPSPESLLPPGTESSLCDAPEPTATLPQPRGATGLRGSRAAAATWPALAALPAAAGQQAATASEGAGLGWLQRLVGEQAASTQHAWLIEGAVLAVASALVLYVVLRALRSMDGRPPPLVLGDQVALEPPLPATGEGRAPEATVDETPKDAHEPIAEFPAATAEPASDTGNLASAVSEALSQAAPASAGLAPPADAATVPAAAIEAPQFDPQSAAVLPEATVVPEAAATQAAASLPGDPPGALATLQLQAVESKQAAAEAARRVLVAAGLFEAIGRQAEQSRADVAAVQDEMGHTLRSMAALRTRLMALGTAVHAATRAARPGTGEPDLDVLVARAEEELLQCQRGSERVSEAGRHVGQRLDALHRGVDGIARRVEHGLTESQLGMGLTKQVQAALEGQVLALSGLAEPARCARCSDATVADPAGR